MIFRNRWRTRLHTLISGSPHPTASFYQRRTRNKNCSSIQIRVTRAPCSGIAMTAGRLHMYFDTGCWRKIMSDVLLKLGNTEPSRAALDITERVDLQNVNEVWCGNPSRNGVCFLHELDRYGLIKQWGENCCNFASTRFLLYHQVECVGT